MWLGVRLAASLRFAASSDAISHDKHVVCAAVDLAISERWDDELIVRADIGEIG